MKSIKQHGLTRIAGFAMLILSFPSCDKGNLSPVANLIAFPSIGDTSILFEFSAGESVDDRSFKIALQYRWDFSGMLTPAFSRIPLISLRALPAKFDREIALYPNGYKLESIGGQGVEYRQVLCEFHYQQYEETWVDHSVTFLLKKNLIIGGDNSVYPDLFFNLLLKNIEPLNDTVLRKFRSIDLIYLGADQFYKDYVETYINAGNMDLPPNGNITNGLGLFTMIRSAKRENMVLDQQSFDSLWNGEKTRKLGFVRW